MSAEPGQTEGQVSEGTQEGTTQATPAGEEGQSVTSTQTTGTGSAGADESFFDPTSIQDSPELMKAYKQMQSAYTKKSQTFKEAQKKVEAYDAFQANPQAYLQQLAQQYGYSLNQPHKGNGESWEPQTWEDVVSHTREELMKDFQPILSELNELKKSNLEKTLDDSCPDWRIYEDDMMTNLKSHPSLVKDPVKLYRMSVPEEVLNSQATQRALKKLQTKTDNAQVSGGSTTTKTANSLPRGPLSFNDAVKAAEAKLAADGVRKPGAA